MFAKLLISAAGFFLLLACASQAVSGSLRQTEALSVLPIDIAEQGLDGRTWFVSLDGDDGNAGTEDAPLRTPQAAAGKVEPGDTVLVRGGLYQYDGPEFPLTIRRGGTADAWVRFASYPGETAVIEFNAIRGIRVEAPYVLVEGFELDGRSDEVDPAAATAHAEAFKGEDHSQHAFFGVGIRIQPSEETPDVFPHHIILRGNTIHDTSGGGIATARADYVLIEHNHVYRTSFYTPWGGSGISIWQSSNHDNRQDVYRTVVRGNVSHHNDNRVKFWMLEDFSDGNGIILDALRNTQGELIGEENPEAYNGRILVADNICYANGGRGVNVYESDNIDILHNTLFHNAQRDNIEREIEFGRTTGTVVAHNIIVAENGINYWGGYESDDLLLYRNLLRGGVVDGRFGAGENPMAANPRFVADDPANAGDLNLSDNSPARDAALDRFDFTSRMMKPAEGERADLGAAPAKVDR